MAVSWWSLLCEPERTSAIRSITLAMSGSFSPIVKAGDGRVDRLVLAADVVGRVGLEVEAVVMRNAAAQEDEDDRLGRGRTLLPGMGPPFPGFGPQERG